MIAKKNWEKKLKSAKWKLKGGNYYKGVKQPHTQPEQKVKKIYEHLKGFNDVEVRFVHF